MPTIPKTKKDVLALLDFLNQEYLKVHERHEDLYWVSYMGDRSVDNKFTQAKNDLNGFRSNREFFTLVEEAQKVSKDKNILNRLALWHKFFRVWQIPEKLLPIMAKVTKLEAQIQDKQSNFNYGYIDPKTRKFTSASSIKLRMWLTSHDDESIRKACYEGLEKSSDALIDEYIQYATLLNKFAKELGFEDFYAYKVFVEEGMTKDELFKIFDQIFEKTKHAFRDIRLLAKDNPKMQKPWNFSYMIAADFEKEEDQYFQFDSALELWAKTFANLGVDFRKSKIKLDLLDRKGKYANGFCHWPRLIHYKKGIRITGQADFTCNVVPGQIGAGEEGMHTLFHEGGHAAHYLNSDIEDVCVNNEFPPSSTAWAETQSMFMDTIFSSVEWRTRYAKNKDGKSYPFDLFERKLDKLHAFSPLGMMGIMKVMNFEKEIYESKSLTRDRVIGIAKRVNNKFSAFKYDSKRLLQVVHIYCWENTCSYHGYGLAELALSQWREYFFKKFGYIVDNPNVGKEMTKVWKLAMSKTFPEFVKLATGKKLSPNAFIKSTTRSKAAVLRLASQRIDRLKKVKTKNTNDINARIELVHGKKHIADNSKGFALMAQKYNSWLAKQK